MDDVELFGQAPRTLDDLNQHGDKLEVLNNDEFESVGFEED